MAKKGFYPWIKSVFGKKDPEPIECVYAGPIPPKDEDPVMEEVYAGPEFFEQDPDCAEETPEEDAPLPPDETERLEKEDREPEEELFAQNAPIPPEPVQMPVYAGPQYFDPQPMTMMVYAGPEFFNHPEDPVMNGAPAPVPMPENKPDDGPVPEGMVKCPACGLLVYEGSKYCSECGAPFETKE